MVTQARPEKGHSILPDEALDLMPEEKLPEYENPPVSEVVTGLYFNKLPLLLPHFGLIWQERSASDNPVSASPL